MKINPIIFTARPVAMQKIADLMGHGHNYYCCGTINVERLQHLLAKFDLNFQVFDDRNVRARRKREKLGNVQLVLWYSNGMVHWWLLATPPEAGEHRIHHVEKLHNALDRLGRIQIDGFELVLLPKKDNPKFKATNKQKEDSSKSTRLTWRMSETKYLDWRISIIDTVRSRSTSNMHHLLYRLWSAPGFGGIRSQIGKLAALYSAEVKRASIKDAPMPPKCLGYVRRLKHQGITMLQLISQTQRSSTLPQSVRDGS